MAKMKLILVFLAVISFSLALAGCNFDVNEKDKSSSEKKVLSALIVDYRALVSNADLIYKSPAEVPVEGQPIGNGRMGTLVWTTPGTVQMQINRTDVFAVNKYHAGPRKGPTDYCGGCAKVTIDVGGRPFQAGETFSQYLSLYEAECTITGDGLFVRCFVSSTFDVLAMEVNDQRAEPQPLRVTVSMWRPPEVKTGNHTAHYTFHDDHKDILVAQQFDERDYHCASAVAARIDGYRIQAEKQSERSRILIAPAKKGKRTILISSSASRSPQENVCARAAEILNEASEKSYDVLREDHVRWWSSFWSRTFVHISSPNGVGSFMERVRNLHLYYMASTSRGELPPKWNGSIFVTDGDNIRYWGSQFWVWTTEISYFPLYASDAIDLTEPFWGMYLKQLPDCEKAALQRWGAKGGVFYGETTPFDGPVVLPEDVAKEYRDVYHGSKKNNELSDYARALCQYDYALSTVLYTEKTGAIGRYSWISHIVSSGCELAVQAWWRYRYTGDKQWLQKAYPLLRGAVELYRHIAKKEEDGLYHFYGLNQHEPFWGVNDGIIDLAAIRGTAPLAIRTAEILDIDAELRIKWKEFLDNLAPYPMGSDPQSKALHGGTLADDVWSVGHLGEVQGQHPYPGETMMWPVFPFENWTLETRDAETDRIVQKLAKLNPFRRTMLTSKPYGDEIYGSATRTPITGSRVGRGYELPLILASYYHGYKPLPNGFSLFEGFNKVENQAHSIEHLGCITTALQEGLLQSLSPHPGQPEVLNVFPAWPKEWEASFRLLARGGFMVTSSIRNGDVDFVEIESRVGETCQLRNPWGKPCLVTEIGGNAQELDGDILRFATGKGRLYRVLPKGRPVPTPYRISHDPGTERASYSLSLPNGTIVTGTLGR